MNTGSLTEGKREKSFVATGSIPEAAPESASTRGGKDSVAHSQDALLLTEALHVAQNTPDVRKDKVATLRERVSAGEYKIDNLELAAALLREEPGLFCQ